MASGRYRETPSYRPGTEPTEARVSYLIEQLSSGVQTVVGNMLAFAAVKMDGSVVTWGDAELGGDSRGVAEQLSSGVQTVVGNSAAFAAVKVDGSVVTWGFYRWDPSSGTP